MSHKVARGLGLLYIVRVERMGQLTPILDTCGEAKHPTPRREDGYLLRVRCGLVENPERWMRRAAPPPIKMLFVVRPKELRYFRASAL